MSGERRLDRQANDEPSLAMSFVVLCVVLALGTNAHTFAF